MVPGKKAILVLGYNRPHTTKRVLAALGEYAPERLYVACDGPKLGDDRDISKVQAVRQVMSQPRWDCTVTTLFRPENVGLRVAVTDALDWFFAQEDEGIIIEDDCVPSPDFFRLAEHSLDTYRHNPDVWGMTGSNTAGVTLSNEASYGFAQHPLIWGWASWSNRWKQRDYDLSTFPSPIRAAVSKSWPSRHHKHVFFRHLNDMVFTGLPNTWDYPWSWTVMSKRGLWLVPNAHLIENIGFDLDATHTAGLNSLSGPPVSELGQIVSPVVVEANTHAEREILIGIHRLRQPLWTNTVRFTARFLQNLFRFRRKPPPALPARKEALSG